MSPVELVYCLNNGISVLHKIFDNDKSNAEYDKRYGYHEIVIEMLIEPVIEKNTDNRCRNAR